MPTYTYHCESCGIRFDQYQKFTEDPLTICPECGEITLRKVYQPVGIVFKGKGFYATDHRSPSGQSAKSEKTETPGETKPETAGLTDKPKPEAVKSPSNEKIAQ